MSEAPAADVVATAKKSKRYYINVALLALVLFAGYFIFDLLVKPKLGITLVAAVVFVIGIVKSLVGDSAESGFVGWLAGAQATVVLGVALPLVMIADGVTMFVHARSDHELRLIPGRSLSGLNPTMASAIELRVLRNGALLFEPRKLKLETIYVGALDNVDGINGNDSHKAALREYAMTRGVPSGALDPLIDDWISHKSLVTKRLMDGDRIAIDLTESGRAPKHFEKTIEATKRGVEDIFLERPEK